MATTSTMTEHPILFSGEMVRAIREGRKTQTRRVLDRVRGFSRVTEFQKSDTRGYDWTFRCPRMLWQDFREADLLRRCPYGSPGDRLWVRETWMPDDTTAETWYRADYTEAQLTPGNREYLAWNEIGEGRWRPSIHMPRSRARLFLEVTEVRVQRLQDISEADAKAEGVADPGCLTCGESSYPKPCGCGNPQPSYVESFANLWDSINGKRDGCSWAASPWVWAVSFKRVNI